MTDQISSSGVSRERQPYEAPSFDLDQLTLVTLGGSPGTGDSGAPGSQSPFVAGDHADFEDSSVDDGDYW